MSPKWFMFIFTVYLGSVWLAKAAYGTDSDTSTIINSTLKPQIANYSDPLGMVTNALSMAGDFIGNVIKMLIFDYPGMADGWGLLVRMIILIPTGTAIIWGFAQFFRGTSA